MGRARGAVEIAIGSLSRLTAIGTTVLLLVAVSLDLDAHGVGPLGLGRWWAASALVVFGIASSLRDGALARLSLALAGCTAFLILGTAVTGSETTGRVLFNTTLVHQVLLVAGLGMLAWWIRREAFPSRDPVLSRVFGIIVGALGFLIVATDIWFHVRETASPAHSPGHVSLAWRPTAPSRSSRGSYAGTAPRRWFGLWVLAFAGGEGGAGGPVGPAHGVSRALVPRGRSGSHRGLVVVQPASPDPPGLGFVIGTSGSPGVSTPPRKRRYARLMLILPHHG